MKREKLIAKSLTLRVKSQLSTLLASMLFESTVRVFMRFG
jgi:hypothetical protein